MNALTETPLERPTYDDEIDLMDLFQSLWSQRGLIVGITLGCLLALSTMHLALFSLPSSHSVKLNVIFPFKGAESGTYPDGSPFFLSDLTANRTIMTAIEAIAPGIDANDLARALTVTPGNALTETLEGALEDLRADKKTPAERIDQLDQTLDQLTAVANKTAHLRLDVGQLGLSANQGERLLLAILDNWAVVAARDFGVSAAKIALPLQPFEWDRDTDIAENIDALSRRLTTLEQSIRNLQTLPGIETTTDGTTSIIDLTTQANLLRNAKVSPLRSFIYEYYSLLAEDSVSIRIQRDGRIRTLELALDEKNGLLESYKTAFDGIAGAGPRLSNAGNQPLASGPGVDGSFLAEMLSLGEQLGEKELKQTLQTKQLVLLEDISALQRELSLIQTDRELAFSKQQVNDYIDSQFPSAIAGVNALRLDTIDLVEVISQRTLNERQALYQLLGQREVTQDRIVTTKLSLQVALAGVLGLMIGCLIALIRGAMRKRQLV